MDRTWHKTNSRNVNDLGVHEAFKNTASLVLNAFIKSYEYIEGAFTFQSLGLRFLFCFCKKYFLTQRSHSQNLYYLKVLDAAVNIFFHIKDMCLKKMWVWTVQ